MSNSVCPLVLNCLRTLTEEEAGKQNRKRIKTTLLCCVRGETVYIDTRDDNEVDTKEEEEEQPDEGEHKNEVAIQASQNLS